MTKIYKFYGILSFLLIMSAFMLTSSKAYAQNLKISGTVKDETGNTLPGVSVLLKGTNNGVTTDANGIFTLNAPSGSTLTLSYIGFQTKEVKIAGIENLNITLSANSKTLNDVVVVGYGTQTKSTVTNAITKVTAKDISASPSAHLGAGLAGRISGVTINARGGEPGAEQVEVF
ncbi:MAG TPA: carboxypeptidase-like regulatory domain-containing protein, partial [Mucilaginibacter sp.]|nr:carboxypeptidase-like regulatory domain-containing protein [Mucilaginibacter sp.]